jgi:hypothetical protein
MSRRSSWECLKAIYVRLVERHAGQSRRFEECEGLGRERTTLGKTCNLRLPRRRNNRRLPTKTSESVVAQALSSCTINTNLLPGKR